MTCFQWVRRRKQDPHYSNIGPQDTSSFDGPLETQNTSIQIPGGLNGIRSRMAEMGHFMNDAQEIQPTKRDGDHDRGHLDNDDDGDDDDDYSHSSHSSVSDTNNNEDSPIQQSEMQFKTPSTNKPAAITTSSSEQKDTTNRAAAEMRSITLRSRSSRKNVGGGVRFAGDEGGKLYHPPDGPTSLDSSGSHQSKDDDGDGKIVMAEIGAVLVPNESDEKEKAVSDILRNFQFLDSISSNWSKPQNILKAVVPESIGSDGSDSSIENSNSTIRSDFAAHSASSSNPETDNGTIVGGQGAQSEVVGGSTHADPRNRVAQHESNIAHNSEIENQPFPNLGDVYHQTHSSTNGGIPHCETDTALDLIAENSVLHPPEVSQTPRLSLISKASNSEAKAAALNVPQLAVMSVAQNQHDVPPEERISEFRSIVRAVSHPSLMYVKGEYVHSSGAVINSSQLSALYLQCHGTPGSAEVLHAFAGSLGWQEFRSAEPTELDTENDPKVAQDRSAGPSSAACPSRPGDTPSAADLQRPFRMTALSSSLMKRRLGKSNDRIIPKFTNLSFPKTDPTANVDYSGASTRQSSFEQGSAKHSRREGPVHRNAVRHSLLTVPPLKISLPPFDSGSISQIGSVVEPKRESEPADLVKSPSQLKGQLEILRRLQEDLKTNRPNETAMDRKRKLPQFAMSIPQDDFPTNHHLPAHHNNFADSHLICYSIHSPSQTIPPTSTGDTTSKRSDSRKCMLDSDYMHLEPQWTAKDEWADSSVRSQRSFISTARQVEECEGRDLLIADIRRFRDRKPPGTFHEWLSQIAPDMIARAILTSCKDGSSKGTGVWRALWDEVVASESSSLSQGRVHEARLLLPAYSVRGDAWEDRDRNLCMKAHVAPGQDVTSQSAAAEMLGRVSVPGRIIPRLNLSREHLQSDYATR